MLKPIALILAFVFCVNIANALDTSDGSIHTLMNVASGLFLWGTTDPAQTYCPAGQTTYSRNWMGQGPSGTDASSNDMMWILKAVIPYATDVRMLVSYKTGLCLDGNTDSSIQQVDSQHKQPFTWTCNPSACNHQWRIVDTGGGNLNIISMCNTATQYLDGNTAASGQCDSNHPSPFLWGNSASSWQVWWLSGPHCSTGCSDPSRCLPNPSTGKASCGEWDENNMVFQIDGVKDILTMSVGDRSEINKGTSAGDTTVTSYLSTLQWSFKFLCTRNNQADVGKAYRINNGCPGGSCPSSNVQMWDGSAGLQCSSSIHPDSLNFFFPIFMTLSDGTQAKFWMGQGHSGSDNNWWIGGQTLTNQGCINGGNPAVFTIGSQRIALAYVNPSTFKLTKA